MEFLIQQQHRPVRGYVCNKEKMEREKEEESNEGENNCCGRAEHPPSHSESEYKGNMRVGYELIIP